MTRYSARRVSDPRSKLMQFDKQDPKVLLYSCQRSFKSQRLRAARPEWEGMLPHILERHARVVTGCLKTVTPLPYR